MLHGSLRQVSSRGEQCGSVLSAHKGVGSSQPADSGHQSCTMVLILSSTLAPVSPQCFREGTSSPWGPCPVWGMSGFSGMGWFGRLHALLCAWQRVSWSVSPTSIAHCRPWEYYFPAAGWSLGTCSHWLQSYSSGSSLAILESRMKVFSSTTKSRGLACSAVC